MTETKQSILTQYYRQPEIYITLPNKGKFYPEGSLELTASGEIPVYAMTAKDDISIKTPDSLMSGEAVVNCIKSCIPNILDPWKMPATEVDYALIAIRIASHGSNMDISTHCPKCEEEQIFAINLSHYIDDLISKPIDTKHTVIKYNVTINRKETKIKETILIHIKPITYKDFSIIQRKSYEEQRVMILAEKDDTITKEDRRIMYDEILKNMTDLNFEMISSGVAMIELPDGTQITDTTEILNFVDNTPISLFNQINKTLNEIRQHAVIEPLDIKCTTKDCEHNYTSPIIFDYSSFFV